MKIQFLAAPGLRKNIGILEVVTTGVHKKDVEANTVHPIFSRMNRTPNGWRMCLPKRVMEIQREIITNDLIRYAGKRVEGAC